MKSILKSLANTKSYSCKIYNAKTRGFGEVSKFRGISERNIKLIAERERRPRVAKSANRDAIYRRERRRQDRGQHRREYVSARPIIAPAIL